MIFKELIKGRNWAWTGLLVAFAVGMAVLSANAGPMVGSFDGGVGAPTDIPVLTSTASGDLSAEVNLGALTTGLLKVTVAAGVATPSTAAAGTDYQAASAALASIAGLTETNGGIPYGTADNAYAWLAAGGAGKILMGAGAAPPAWTTPTYPNAATTTGAYIRADGTNFIQSTLVLPNAGDAFYLPVFTAANTMGQLAASGTTGQILTAVTGAVPGWSSTLGVTTLNLPTSDADPATTAGQIRHDSTDTGSSAGGTLKWLDGGTVVRSVVDTGTNYTIITKTEYIPIAYAEDGAAAPAAASVWADTRKAKIRVFAADADDDVEIHWIAPLDYVGGIKFRAVGFVDNATAPADTETVIFNLAGCSVGNSDDGGCTLGTGVDSTFTADATYAQHDRWSTAFSNEITVTNITAGESVMLKLFRDVDDTYAQGIGVAGIEIKYKAKIIGFAGY